MKISKGFTLVELMIVVAIVGILSAIAYPSYRESVIKAHRTDGKAALLAAAQAMERYYTENQNYASANLATIYRTTSEEGYYDLTFSGGVTVNPIANTNSFTLEAAPTTKGGQNGDTRCGTFTLTHTGVKGVASASLTAAECWGG